MFAPKVRQVVLTQVTFMLNIHSQQRHLKTLLTPWSACLTLGVSVQDAESSWQFDIFGYADATPGTSLSMLTYHLMKQTGIIGEFHLDQNKLCRYLQKVESGYDAQNPYHNRYSELEQEGTASGTSVSDDFHAVKLCP